MGSGSHYSMTGLHSAWAGQGPQDKPTVVFISDLTTLVLLFLAPAWNVKGSGERFLQGCPDLGCSLSAGTRPW